MPKKKVAIALSDWLLDELDGRARKLGVSRSSLVEEATARYVSAAKAREDDEEYRVRTAAALEDMDRFRKERAADPRAKDEPSSLERLRALRASPGRSKS